MSLSSPAVSICVPTYNGMPYLPQTIDSVLQQTDPDFEVLVVDDCSTDGTAAYLASLTDSRVRVLRNEQNLGVAATWTRAMDLATAPLVKLLCHDDVLDPTCIAKQRSTLQANPNAVLCTCWRHVIDARNRHLMTRRGLAALKAALPGKSLIRTIVARGGNPIGEPSAVLVRRDAWQRVRPFPGDNLYMIDIWLWTRLLEHGDAAVVPEPLCSFRVIPTSLSAHLAGRQGRDARRFFRELSQRHHMPKRLAWAGQVRATFSAYARQLVFARARSAAATASDSP